jgi:hypothetical protein
MEFERSKVCTVLEPCLDVLGKCVFKFYKTMILLMRPTYLEFIGLLEAAHS